MSRFALILVLLAPPAAAGPWARGEGQTFLSLGYEAAADLPRALDPERPELDLAHVATVYAERGLGPRLTFGLDGAADLADDGRSAYVFLRRTLTPGDAAQQWALTGGLGLRDPGDGAQPLGVLGASWGRGLDTRWGGWTNVDLQARLIETGIAGKLDATLGLKPGERLSLIGQLRLSDYPGSSPEAWVVSSAVREMTDRISLEIGVLQEVTGDRATGLKLGTWLEF